MPKLRGRYACPSAGRFKSLWPVGRIRSPLVERRPLDLSTGDVVVLKKPHPCGSNRWQIVRLGADIGLRCQGCERRFLISRAELARRIKSISSDSPALC